jgi:hypothetical protein
VDEPRVQQPELDGRVTPALLNSEVVGAEEAFAKHRLSATFEEPTKRQTASYEITDPHVEELRDPALNNRTVEQELGTALSFT